MSAADHLSPRQHHEYIYTHDLSSGSDSGTRYDSYRLLRRSTGEAGDVEHHEVGNLTVHRFRGHPEHVGFTPKTAAPYNDRWYNDYATSTAVTANVYDPDWGDSYDRQIGRQGRLFEYHPAVAAKHKVDYFGGTEAARAPNLVMLGLAENNARAEGTSLLPSEDLSKHSSRLVERLKGTGAVSESASTQVTNDIQFSWEYSASAPRDDNRVPEEQVQAARQTVRQTLKGSRAKRRPSGQGTLF